MINLQNIDDEAFSKRHCKQEAEEKRRKRLVFKAKHLKNLQIT